MHVKKKTRRAWPKTQTHVLAYGTKIGHVTTLQADALQTLKPVWTYGIQLWGCMKPSNTAIIQRFQNKMLRNIVDAPWYVRNADLHRDLKMGTVTAEIKRLARKHEERLPHYENVKAIHLLDNSELLRRLKRTKPFEFVTCTKPRT